MAEPTAADLRQQYRSKLDAGLVQGRELLDRYQQAYPDLSQIDWPGVQSGLAVQPVSGVNVHAAPAGLRPSWIQEQTIEPVEFGSFADPVSQLAFLAAPGMLRASKTALETIGSPGPSRLGLPYRPGERGNLGPVPRSQQGVPLPESAVRDEGGQLKRLYHGTPTKYADFEMSHMDPEGLYGPGIYMTESPEVAGGTAEEIARGYAGYATKGWDPDLPGHLTQLRDGYRYQLPLQQKSLRELQARAQDPGISAGARARALEQLPRAEYQVKETQTALESLDQEIANAARSGPHVRPVYADLKRPFDIEGEASMDEVGRFLDIAQRLTGKSISAETREAFQRGIMTNKALFNTLGKELAPQVIREAGYDGITHMGGAVTGGQPHRVYIAFSPDQVYPSVNVEGTP